MSTAHTVSLAGDVHGLRARVLGSGVGGRTAVTAGRLGPLGGDGLQLRHKVDTLQHRRPSRQRHRRGSKGRGRRPQEGGGVWMVV